MAFGIKLFKGTKSSFDDIQTKIDEFFINMPHIKILSIHQTQSFDPVNNQFDLVISLNYEF